MEKRWKDYSVRRTKEAVNQRTKFLRSMWQDWDRARLDEEET